MSSTSSSDEEDYSKFASCAVSAVQIEQTARVEAQKRRSTSSRGGCRTTATATAAATSTAAAAGHSGDSNDQGPGIDAVSVKIAAALDAILARELDSSSSKPETATAAVPVQQLVASTAAAASEHPSHATDPVSCVAAAGDTTGKDEDEDLAGVRLFAKVPRGTPCKVPLHSSTADITHGDSAFLGQLTDTHPDGTAAFGSGSLPRRQPLRDQIPRLSLAEQSRQACKRKHEQVLSALTVDGHALLAAAAAAGYAGGAGLPGSAAGTNSSSKVGGGKNATSSTAAWVKGWKRLKGQKAPGVVVEAKEFVPYDVRAAKLLGTQRPIGLSS